MPPDHSPKNPILPLLAWGCASLALYLLLFAYEKPLLEWSARGQWFFGLPVLIALVFSFIHGNFTARFWALLGVRAKSSTRKASHG